MDRTRDRLIDKIFFHEPDVVFTQTDKPFDKVDKKGHLQ